MAHVCCSWERELREVAAPQWDDIFSTGLVMNLSVPDICPCLPLEVIETF